jgi:cytochrome c peroxidase
MRKSIVIAMAAAAVAAGTALAAPASADVCTAPQLAAGTCTSVTVTVLDGTLSILVTPTAVGTSGTVTSTAAALADVNLGPTLVTDTRLSATGWISKATASTFTPVVAGPTAIPVSASQFYVNPTGTVPGLATLSFSNGTGTSGANAPVASGANLVSATATGPSVVTYVPMLRLTVPANQPGGAYTGTVTQSVS